MFRKIQKVIQHINVHMGETITICDLAQAADLSRSRLCDLFKTETGLAPMQYVKRRRIEHARELFETTALSVREVRLMVGLPDRSHFAREFKGSFGATPSEYRRRRPTETDNEVRQQ
jgi:AraC-like DNA-binding protein